MAKRRATARKTADAEAPSIIETLEDPALFGRMGFDAWSWEPWKAFLTALWALPLALYRHHTGRCSRRFNRGAEKGRCRKSVLRDLAHADMAGDLEKAYDRSLKSGKAART